MTLPHLLGTLLASLGSALVVTVSTEVAVAGLLGFRAPRDLGIVALANLATNPAVNLLLAGVMALAHARALADPPMLAALVLLEVAATVAEWRIYRFALPHHRGRALRVSVIANVASLAVGFAIFGFGTPSV